MKRSLIYGCELLRGHSIEGAVRPFGVTVNSLGFDDFFGVLEIKEPVLVETLVAHRHFKALDEGILGEFSWLDELQFETVLVAPAIQGFASELGVVIGEKSFRVSSLGHKTIKNTADSAGTHRAVRLDGQPLPAVIVYDVQRLNASTVSGLIAHEVHRPAIVELGGRLALLISLQRRPAFLTHWHLEAFLLVDVEDPFVVVLKSLSPQLHNEHLVYPASPFCRKSFRCSPEVLLT